MAEARGRLPQSWSRRERRAEAVVGGGLVVAVGALAVLFPIDSSAFQPLAAAAFAALVLALRVEFDTGSGVTVPSQLAFIPLVFLLPPAVVPIAVAAAWAVAKAPDVLRGELRPSRLLMVLGNSWFTVGPVVVLALADADRASTLALPVAAAALAAQVAGDVAASALREAMIHGAGPREQLEECWVYLVDIALAPIGFVLACQIERTGWSIAALLPLLGVLAFFARERRARVESLIELNNAYRGTALVLGDVVEADDSYTGEHSRGVVALALDVGRHLGLDPDRRRNLEFAALLHDVGKIAIPNQIINKPGKLDPQEWAIIKAHTIEGQRMLDRVGGFMRQVGLIVRSHHEHFDGRGYPDGLAGCAIPLEARIIACCDAFNAMTTTRSYRQAMPPSMAAQELRDCAGTQFDPDVVDAVLAVANLSTDTAVAPAPHRSAA
jgi:putative nucleotidyltransferase with HDIG domain